MVGDVAAVVLPVDHSQTNSVDASKRAVKVTYYIRGTASESDNRPYLKAPDAAAKPCQTKSTVTGEVEPLLNRRDRAKAVRARRKPIAIRRACAVRMPRVRPALLVKIVDRVMPPVNDHQGHYSDLEGYSAIAV